MTRSERSSLVATFLIPLALAVPAAAQLETEPGYFPLDDLELLDPEALTLEINLTGSLLELVAAAMDDEDPDFATLVRGLEGIRVRVAESVDLDLPAVRSGFERASGWLEENGWDTLLRLREEEEEILVYARIAEGEMVGATLLVLEPGSEVVLVNVVGRLDLALLAELADSLDIPQLDVGGRQERSGDVENGRDDL